MPRGLTFGTASVLLLVVAFVVLPLWAPTTTTLQITSLDPEVSLTFSGSLREQSGNEILNINNESTPYATTVERKIFDGIFIASRDDMRLRLQCEVKGLGVTLVQAWTVGHGAKVSVSRRSVTVRGT